MSFKSHASNPTSKFALFAFALTVAVWWLTSLPFLANQVFRYTGIDPLALLGNGGVLGPKKIELFALAAIAAAGLIVLGFVLTLNRQGRIVRLLVVLLTVPTVLAAQPWLDRTPYGAASKRVLYGHLPPVRYEAIFNDANIGRGAIGSYQDLFAAVEANYRRHREPLSKAWKITNEEELRTLFYLNTAANMFAYGNKAAPDQPGCAEANELTRFQTRNPAELGVRFYTESPIGCCSDYAAMLRFFLDEAGIENRIAALPIHGHFFNEAKIDGTWRALDAQTGFYFDRTWNEIVDTRSPFQVTVFPVLSLDRSRPATYRAALHGFRRHILMSAATGAEQARYGQQIAVIDKTP